MKLSLIGLGALGFGLVVNAAACSSSSSSGGGSPIDGGAASSQDSGTNGGPQDSGGSIGSSCGAGTFACGDVTCEIATQYCENSQFCAPYTGSDPCPDCVSPPGECGVGKTSTCSGSPTTGVTISCN